MSNIIKEIEAEQLKATVDEFEVGDTVKVYGKIKEGNRERIPVPGIRNQNTCEARSVSRYTGRKPLLYHTGNLC